MIRAVTAPPAGRSLWAAAIVLALSACTPRGPQSIDIPPSTAEPATAMTATVRIEQHFSGPELALAQAAAQGDAAAVHSLIGERGANPNAVSPGGLPLLAWPVLKNNLAGVEALLAGGADPNRAVPAVGTVMVWAAKAESPALLGAFLAHGGDAGARDPGGQPLTRVAATAGHWDNVKLLIERGAEVDAAARNRDTLLNYYSRGQFDKTLWLLERGADPGGRIRVAAEPERVGAQPVVENIYWWPVNASRFPQLAQAQQRCQDLLAQRGLTLPREPVHLQRLRLSQGANADAGRESPVPIDAEIERQRRELEQATTGRQ